MLDWRQPTTCAGMSHHGQIDSEQFLNYWIIELNYLVIVSFLDYILVLELAELDELD